MSYAYYDPEADIAYFPRASPYSATVEAMASHDRPVRMGATLKSPV